MISKVSLWSLIASRMFFRFSAELKLMRMRVPSKTISTLLIIWSIILLTSIPVPPKITPFSLQGIVSHEGKRVQLFCSVMDGDLPITIEWLKDGKILPAFLKVTTNNLDNYSSSLIISHVTSEHSGNYTCVASNAATTVTHTAPLNVHGKVATNNPPKLILVFF